MATATPYLIGLMSSTTYRIGTKMSIMILELSHCYASQTLRSDGSTHSNLMCNDIYNKIGVNSSLPYQLTS